MLNEEFLEDMKNRLLTEKKKLIKLSLNKDEVDSDGDETDELQANLLIDMNNELVLRANFKLTQIEDALDRIKNNEYGICEDCEDPIPEKRLLINPYFLVCVGCATKREIEEQQRKRA